MTEQRFPKGWDAARVRTVFEHHDSMTDEEIIEEDEAAWNQQGFTMMAIPNELVEQVRALIAAEQKF